MQQRAGLLFISSCSEKVFLLLQDSKWTVPTFSRQSTLLEDAKDLFKTFMEGRIIPIELYLSADKGFEYGTYVCIVEQEFIPNIESSFAWCNLNQLPNNLHFGLKATLNNSIIRTKIDTIMAIENVTETSKSS